MIRAAPRHEAALGPVISRLGALAPLDPPTLDALAEAVARAQPVRMRRDILVEGVAIGGPRLLVSGWAARVRQLADGRRQLISFILPGDLVGLCHQPDPLATSTVVALTDASVCLAPPPGLYPALARAYAVSRALDEAYLLAQVVRLGRFTARERISDLLLELLERLQLAELASDDAFDLPLTQETLGDALGLTSVHVNRMLQLSRREDGLQWRNGRVRLIDAALLAARIGRVPVRVTGEPGLTATLA